MKDKQSQVLKEKISSIFHQSDGKLTRDRRLETGKYGLGKVPQQLNPDATTRAICGFCSTGCCLDIHLKDGQAVNITPTTEYPVNLGMACPKGWEALTPLKSPDRATTPLLRNPHDKLEPVDWHTALSTFTERFKAIQEKYGSASIAFLSTGQIPMEEMAYLGALAKFGMGILHGDGNTRQCMATSVVSYKQSFGFDAPPYTYKDFEESDVIVLIGSNLCVAHPIMWERVMMNKNNPEIVVIDPRATETAMAATQHHAIHPKSDIYLFYGLAHILIEGGNIDKAYIETHTTAFNDFAEHVKSYTPELVSSKTGIEVSRLYHLADTIAQGKRVSFWWTMGVNQSYEGVRVAQSIINLALMTGNIGRPGTGANSITGQCNAMGSRLFSNTTNLLGGHDFTNPQHRQKVADILGIDVSQIPQENSWAYDQIVDGITSGKIKGLWIIATNSSHSWINQGRFNKIIKQLDFLVVQDMYHTTESAQRADLVLPAAAWGEKEGTFINSERRIGLIKKITQAPRVALSDFNIFKLIAHYWGCAELFKDWETPEDVFGILKKVSKGQPCDITGIRDYQMLDNLGGIQWPFKEGASLNGNERRLFSDGHYYHPDGKAKFLFEEPHQSLETPDTEYPFWLLTGRGTTAQWHTQTRTCKSSVLRKLYPEEVYVEINGDDARKLGIGSNELISLISRRGEIQARAYITYQVQQGQIFIPMHYEETNKLTLSQFDPYSRQPSYKACAVKIERSRSIRDHIQPFGKDEPITASEDIQHANILLIIGADMAENHPILFHMIQRRRSEERSTRIIVVDSRHTRTTQYADVHVSLTSGGEPAFLQLVAKRLCAMGRIDKRSVKRNPQGFNTYRKYLETFDEQTLISTYQLHPARIDEVVEFLMMPGHLFSFYSPENGQNTHGVGIDVTLMNLHLQLGQVGRKGSGYLALRG